MSVWILLDVSNGDSLEIETAAKFYFWQFKTRAEARRAKQLHSRANPKRLARLVGPFKIEVVATYMGGNYCKGSYER